MRHLNSTAPNVQLSSFSSNSRSSRRARCNRLRIVPIGTCKNLGHDFVFLAFHVFHHQDGPVFGRQAGERSSNRPPCSACSIACPGRLKSDGSAGSMPWLAIAAGVDANHRPLLPFQADGRVDGDAVQPGEKQRIALEAVQRLIGAQERFLNDVIRIFGIAHEPKDRVVQATPDSGAPTHRRRPYRLAGTQR